jgi:hypothetical protein
MSLDPKIEGKLLHLRATDMWSSVSWKGTTINLTNKIHLPDIQDKQRQTNS